MSQGRLGKGRAAPGHQGSRVMGLHNYEGKEK